MICRVGQSCQVGRNRNPDARSDVELAAKPLSDHVQRMKTTALTAWCLALAGCAGIADTTPPVPAAGTQFDGSYVGQDTLLSGVAFLCGAVDLPERIEVQNGQFAYPFQVNPPRVAPLPVQIFEDGTLAGQMQYGTLGGLADAFVPSDSLVPTG